MSVNESGLGQCECEDRGHASHSLHESGNARRCQRAAKVIRPDTILGHLIREAYLCRECAEYHDRRVAQGPKGPPTI